MGWEQVFTIIISMFGMGLGVILFLTRELRQISRDIHTESKDFHGRLCKIEEKYLDIKRGK